MNFPLGFQPWVLRPIGHGGRAARWRRLDIKERKRRGIILKWSNFDAQISALFERTRANVLGASRSVTYNTKTRIKTECKVRDPAPWPLLGFMLLTLSF